MEIVKWKCYKLKSHDGLLPSAMKGAFSHIQPYFPQNKTLKISMEVLTQKLNLNLDFQVVK